MSLQGDIADEISGAYDIPTYIKIIIVQEEYIKFLEREVGDLSLFANTHGCFIQVPVYEKGCSLRAEIKELKEKL